MIEVNPKNRLSFNELFNHPLIKANLYSNKFIKNK